MDANEIRRMRLKQWVDTEFDGRVAALCRYYGLPDSAPSYLSQLLGGHRVFGERAARKLEKQCARPTGWLDVDPEQESNVEVLRFDRQRCAKLSTEDRELIETFITLILDRKDRTSVKRLNEVQVQSGSKNKIKKAARKPIRRTYTEHDGHAPPQRRRTH
mgnify:CR=1 FL=1